MEVAQEEGVDLAGRRRARDGAALAEDPLRRGDGVEGGLERRGGAGFLGQPGQAVLHRLEVGQDQLGVHRLDVGTRVDPGVDVDDVFVVERAHDLADRIGLADGGQELVAEPLALRRPAYEAGDVHEGHRCRHHRCAVVERGQPLQPRVGHGHHAHVGLDGRERVIGRQRLVVGEGVEQRGLAHVGQADDADRQAHEAPATRPAGPPGPPAP